MLRTNDPAGKLVVAVEMIFWLFVMSLQTRIDPFGVGCWLGAMWILSVFVSFPHVFEAVRVTAKSPG